jgi:hypothetical protein
MQTRESGQVMERHGMIGDGMGVLIWSEMRLCEKVVSFSDVKRSVGYA